MAPRHAGRDRGSAGFFPVAHPRAQGIALILQLPVAIGLHAEGGVPGRAVDDWQHGYADIQGKVISSIRTSIQRALPRYDHSLLTSSAARSEAALAVTRLAVARLSPSLASSSRLVAATARCRAS